MAAAAGKAGAKDAGKGAGKGAGLLAVGALTVIAAVGGGVMGKVLAAKGQAAGQATAQGAAQAAGRAGPAAAEAKPSAYAGDTELRELPAIVTNLAEPAALRIRLQAAIVYSKKATEKPDILAGEIADDIVAYLKTLSMVQFQGASGLQALREDLTERAATRSGGKVREVMIENLVVQ